MATGARRRLDLPDADLQWRPQWISSREAEEWFTALSAEIAWRQRAIRMFGRDIPEPRLTSWHGDPGAQYRYSGRDNHPLPWTPTLAVVRHRASLVTGARFNSVLANLYRDGSDHMGWHADDEPELGDLIASVSLGAVRRMQFRRRPSGPIALDLELPSGSLLVMAGNTQRHYQHRIPKTSRPVAPRINLTLRWVAPAGATVSK